MIKKVIILPDVHMTDTCPKDCPPGSEDYFCDPAKDGICDSDCLDGEDPDCGGICNWIIGIIIAILLIVIGILGGRRLRLRSPNGP